MSAVSRLSYLVFEVSNLGAWARFATDVLGIEVSDAEGGGLALRYDDHQQRILLVEGPADDLAALGWEVDDAPALDALVATLRAAGVEVGEGSDAACRQRRVSRLVSFVDPAGNRVEIVRGAACLPDPWSSPLVRSGFVTGEQGMGHCVVRARTLPESEAFYTGLLGLRHSDRVRTSVHGHPVDIAFLHANPRHHSLALSAHLDRRIHHFLLEVAGMDDVGMAFDRACRSGVEIVLTLGRHPNDRMFSFYARTPSGFEFEYGWGGMQVDDATWQPTIHDRISAWGHVPPGLIPRHRPSRAG